MGNLLTGKEILSTNYNVVVIKLFHFHVLKVTILISGFEKTELSNAKFNYLCTFKKNAL
ncbi:MAG: hypothetical protein QM710_02580 [Flavobacterium sp.]